MAKKVCGLALVSWALCARGLRSGQRCCRGYRDRCQPGSLVSQMLVNGSGSDSDHGGSIRGSADVREVEEADETVWHSEEWLQEHAVKESDAENGADEQLVA